MIEKLKIWNWEIPRWFRKLKVKIIFTLLLRYDKKKKIIRKFFNNERTFSLHTHIRIYTCVQNKYLKHTHKAMNDKRNWICSSQSQGTRKKKNSWRFIVGIYKILFTYDFVRVQQVQINNSLIDKSWFNLPETPENSNDPQYTYIYTYIHIYSLF